MDLQTLKLEIVKRILEQESKDVLDKLYAFLQKEEKDFWLELTDDQKEEVNLGIQQIENGETVEWEEYLKRVS